MKRILAIPTIAALMISVASTVSQAQTGASSAGGPMDCKAGPVEKTYGGSQWLVYGCSDGKSVVFVAAPNTPASPFYFSLTPDRLFGEGTGSTKATDAAYAEIHALTSDDLAELVRETQTTASRK
jgi:hypothetical protein